MIANTRRKAIKDKNMRDFGEINHRSKQKNVPPTALTGNRPQKTNYKPRYADYRRRLTMLTLVNHRKSEIKCGLFHSFSSIIKTRLSQQKQVVFIKIRVIRNMVLFLGN